MFVCHVLVVVCSCTFDHTSNIIGVGSRPCYQHQVLRFSDIYQGRGFTSKFIISVQTFLVHEVW